MRRTQRLLEERTSVAETRQRAMLPQLPSPRGQLAGRHLTAHSNNRVGGDWFDGFCTADDVTVPAIGDTDSTRPRRDRTTDLPVGSTLVLCTDGWPGRSPG